MAASARLKMGKSAISCPPQRGTQSATKPSQIVEVKHINYLPVKPGRNGIGGGVVEPDTVKSAVYYIAHGSAQNKRNAPQQAGVESLSPKVPGTPFGGCLWHGHAKEVNGHKNRSHQPEKGESRFCVFMAKLDSESHALVEDVVELKPVAKYFDFTRRTWHHLVVYEQFHHLVDGNDAESQQEIFSVFKFQVF